MDNVNDKIKHLEPHQLRVVQEAEDLADKITKLTNFTTTDIFKNLSEVDQILLKSQLFHMKGYVTVLQARIKRF